MFFLETESLVLRASLVPWDSAILQHPVAQIDEIRIIDSRQSDLDYAAFEAWRDSNGCQFISCRLNHALLSESIFLERKEFRFIEMVLHPKIEGLAQLIIPDEGLTVSGVDKDDLPAVRKVAETCFVYERFHLDPRVDRHIGNMRYGQWVTNTLEHPRQRLLKISDNDLLIGFFIVESIGEGDVYWHLTAISPQYQGKGYGRRTWLTMLRYHQQDGKNAIITTISARNTPILNLYSSLSFRFMPPQMTFHWLREENVR